MMTGTEVEITFIKSCSNMLINTELNQLMQRNLVEVAPVQLEEEDLELARRIRETLGPVHSYFDTVAAEITDPEERARVAADADSLVHRIVLPLARERQGFVSSDVGDVSWNCPVAQINAATMPAGVPMHSWQMVAVGKSAMAKKGMLYAAKVHGRVGPLTRWRTPRSYAGPRRNSANAQVVRNTRPPYRRR